MRVVIQRVCEASVKINGQIKSSIHAGLLILIGFVEDDTIEDAQWLCSKIANLRIFNDQQGLMNLSSKELNAPILLISQFTLYASTKKGNRPSFIKAAKPEVALPLYESFILSLEKELNTQVFTGVFGADMKVALINDGPVTIIIDSKNKE